MTNFAGSAHGLERVRRATAGVHNVMFTPLLGSCARLNMTSLLTTKYFPLDDGKRFLSVDWFSPFNSLSAY